MLLATWQHPCLRLELSEFWHHIGIYIALRLIIEVLQNLYEANIDLFRYPINWATRLDCASLEWTPE